jgi:hypothetical protein
MFTDALPEASYFTLMMTIDPDAVEKISLPKITIDTIGDLCRCETEVRTPEGTATRHFSAACETERCNVSS